MPWAEDEGRRVALVGGEPGSGKSRLVREFAREAAADGALVLYGACDAVVRTPYEPFVEALDHLARVTDPDHLRAALGPAGGELTRLLPDLPAHRGRHAREPLRDARRPAPLRGRREDAAHRPVRPGGDRVRPPGGGRRGRAGPRRRDRGPHRRQRVPGLRAVANARRDGGGG